MEQNEDKRIFNKGKNAQISPLLEQGRVHVVLSKKHESAHSRFGWPPSQTEVLVSRIDGLDALFSNRSSATQAAISATETEAAMRREAKAFIRCLRYAVPMVVRLQQAKGITKKSFNAGGPLGNKTRKISGYLMKVRPFVETLNEAFAPYFGGDDPLEELKRVKANLDDADADQEVKQKSLPEETVKIYMLAGQILDMIEDINRVGKIAYDGKAEMIAQFNKDILRRGGKGGSQDSSDSAAA